MKNEQQLKRELEYSLSSVSVPESLYRFADQVPELCAEEETGTRMQQMKPVTRRTFRIVPSLAKSAAAALILTVTFSAGVMTSPAFASYMKEVPAINIAVEWLAQMRQTDGVQKAIDHRYAPIKPVTAQFGNTNITIGDMYLTDEELIFKAYYTTDKFDVASPDPRNFFSVTPVNLPGAAGSTSRSAIIQSPDGQQKTILQESYKYVLDEKGVRDFLADNDELKLSVMHTKLDRKTKSAEHEELGAIFVPIDRSKLLHNKVLTPKQSLDLAATDPDVQVLSLDKLTVQPTSINAILSVQNGWKIDFPREEATAPYLKDQKGNVYPYDPSGSVLMLEDGKIQLPFTSSVYFDDSVDTLYLHIGEVSVFEKQPSGHFDLSVSDTFPKTVHFKNKTIVIESAEYREGYLYLRVGKDPDHPKALRGVTFTSPEYDKQLQQNRDMAEKLDALRMQLGIPGWESAIGFSNKRPFLEVYVPAFKQDKYRIDLQRVNDAIEVNQDYPVKLK